MVLDRTAETIGKPGIQPHIRAHGTISARIIVFFPAPVTRTVERIEHPSMRQLIICALVVLLSLFMRISIQERFSMLIAINKGN